MGAGRRVGRACAQRARAAGHDEAPPGVETRPAPRRRPRRRLEHGELLRRERVARAGPASWRARGARARRRARPADAGPPSCRRWRAGRVRRAAARDQPSARWRGRPSSVGEPASCPRPPLRPDRRLDRAQDVARVELGGELGRDPGHGVARQQRRGDRRGRDGAGARMHVEARRVRDGEQPAQQLPVGDDEEDVGLEAPARPNAGSLASPGEKSIPAPGRPASGDGSTPPRDPRGARAGSRPRSAALGRPRAAQGSAWRRAASRRRRCARGRRFGAER
jgi:hypothetical protein